MALSKFLDPKLDLTFKKIFSTEKNKNILIHFLNDILGCTEVNTIQEVEFLSTIMDPEIASDKQSIVDVLCRGSSGNRYIIEMQPLVIKALKNVHNFTLLRLTQDKLINLVNTLI